MNHSEVPAKQGHSARNCSDGEGVAMVGDTLFEAAD
jgi:hypothetical protein